MFTKIYAVHIGILYVLLSITGCQNEGLDPEPAIDLTSLPVSVPEPVLTVDAIDTMLFAFLYYDSMSLEDGSVLLPDYRRSQMFQLNRDGSGQVVADNGRGPGEIQFVNNLSLGPDGYINVYDMRNNRMTLFNQNLTYEREFVVNRSVDEMDIESIYPTSDPDLLLAISHDRSYLRDIDPDPVLLIGLYRKEDGSYSDWIRLPRGRIAFSLVDGEIHSYRPMVYMPQTHYSMHPEGGSLYLYWPPSNKIAELSLSMDTLRVIQMDLPEERMTNSDRDSLLDRQTFVNSASQRIWYSQLPEVKTPVDRFFVDDLGRFWIRLTRRSPAQEWLILDDEGEALQIVQLPKEGNVTHVSSQNIGFRNDHMTFSLYELGD